MVRIDTNQPLSLSVSPHLIGAAAEDEAGHRPCLSPLKAATHVGLPTGGPLAGGFFVARAGAVDSTVGSLPYPAHVRPGTWLPSSPLVVMPGFSTSPQVFDSSSSMRSRRPSRERTHRWGCLSHSMLLVDTRDAKGRQPGTLICSRCMRRCVLGSFGPASSL